MSTLNYINGVKRAIRNMVRCCEKNIEFDANNLNKLNILELCDILTITRTPSYVNIDFMVVKNNVKLYLNDYARTRKNELPRKNVLVNGNFISCLNMDAIKNSIINDYYVYSLEGFKKSLNTFVKQRMTSLITIISEYTTNEEFTKEERDDFYSAGVVDEKTIRYIKYHFVDRNNYICFDNCDTIITNGNSYEDILKFTKDTYCFFKRSIMKKFVIVYNGNIMDNSSSYKLIKNVLDVNNHIDVQDNMIEIDDFHKSLFNLNELDKESYDFLKEHPDLIDINTRFFITDMCEYGDIELDIRLSYLSDDELNNESMNTSLMIKREIDSFFDIDINLTLVLNEVSKFYSYFMNVKSRYTETLDYNYDEEDESLQYYSEDEECDSEEYDSEDDDELDDEE